MIRAAIIVGAVVLVQWLATEAALRGEWPWSIAPPRVSLYATSVISLFFFTSLYLELVLPGRPYKGPLSTCGQQETYKDNAVAHCVFSHIVFFLGASLGLWPMSVLAARYDEILSTLNVIGFGVSVLLLLKGRHFPSGPTPPARGGLHDFFWGVELYPKVCGLSVKRVFNCRFSMLFWMLHSVSSVFHEHERHGSVSKAGIAVAVSQWLYLLKFFCWERGYMSSLDIVMDRCGFYLIWGVIAFVPAVYTVHLRCVAERGRGTDAPWWTLAFSVLSIFLNYRSDLARYRFRHTPAPTQSFIAVTYQVERGGHKTIEQSRLLVAGVWGALRHPNYLFELCVAWSWVALSDPLGTRGVSALYALVLTILLFHRAKRDEAKCLAKYGPGYQEYMRRVPSRIIPWIW